MLDNKEYTSFNRIINELNFVVLEHGHVHADKDWVFDQINSPFNRMYFVIDGSGEIFNEEGRVRIEDGRVYLVPLGTTFNYRCDHHLHMFYIHFRIELIPGQDLFENDSECSSYSIEQSKLDELLGFAGNTQVSDLIRCNALFYDAIGKFLEKETYNFHDQVQLMGDYGDVYRFVKEHCNARLKVRDVAIHFGSNLSTFSKRFKNHTGMTLKSYIDSKLIREVQERLLVSDLTIKEIAYELDFSDEFHFSRYFKRHVGSSPNNYRKRSNIYK